MFGVLIMIVVLMKVIKLRSSTGSSCKLDVTNWTNDILLLSQNLSKADTDKTESFNFNLGTTF